MPVTINGTTGIAGVDGSNTTPAIKGGTSTGTGVFYGTNTVSLATGGTTAVTVDSSQNVGIGTASPGYKLDINGAVNTNNGYIAQTNLNAAVRPLQIRNSSSGSSAYTIFDVGNDTGAFALELLCMSSTNTAYAGANSGAILVGYGNFLFQTQGASTDIRFATATAERMRLEATNGYLLVGYTSSNGAYKLQVNSQIFATSATIATSDARYKENVEPITDGLGIVNALNPVSFDWKQHPVHEFDLENKQVGFLAQEVQTAIADKPYLNSIIKANECELPDGTKEEFLGIAEGNMIAILTSAIKELSAKLDAAEARIAALEAK